MALFLLWKADFYSYHWLLYLRRFTMGEWWLLFFNWFSFGNVLWDICPASPQRLMHVPMALMLLQVVFFVLFSMGVIFVYRKTRKINGLEFLSFLFFLPLLLLISSWMGQSAYLERTVLIILPFFYMVLAKGAVGIKSKTIRTVMIGLLVASSLLSIWEFDMKKEQWTVYKPKPDWKSVTGYFIKEEKSSGQPLTILVGNLTNELFYYRDGFFKKDHVLLRFSLQSRYPLRLIRGAASEPKVFYLIYNKFWLTHTPELMKAIAADSQVRLLSVQKFKGGVDVYKWSS